MTEKEKAIGTLRWCVENFWEAVQQSAPAYELEQLEDELETATAKAKRAGATGAEVFAAQKESMA
jgi:hypothetical protein